eukprot:1144573-Pelagomonas_calceolata.AAC.2
MLPLCRLQLLFRPCVFTVLDFNQMNMPLGCTVDSSSAHLYAYLPAGYHQKLMSIFWWMAAKNVQGAITGTNDVPVSMCYSFKYLGMLFTKQCNPQATAEHMCAPFLAGCRQIRPHTMLWLIKAHALPASMAATDSAFLPNLGL